MVGVFTKTTAFVSVLIRTDDHDWSSVRMSTRTYKNRKALSYQLIRSISAYMRSSILKICINETSHHVKNICELSKIHVNLTLIKAQESFGRGKYD